MGRCFWRYRYLLLVAAALVAIVSARALPARRPAVTVWTARRGSLELRIAASGLVEGVSADLSFVTTGRIAQVYVDEGTRVARSQPLARISPISATYGTPPDVVDVIQAPYDGIVVAIYQRPGAVVNPGQAVLRVVSAAAPWVTVFLESDDAQHLRPGQRLSCRAGGYMSQSWDLVVEEVGKEAVPRPDLPGSSRQVRVRCSVADRGFTLPPGADVDVDGMVPLAHDALLIPAAAVMQEGARMSVWVLDGGRVRRREIQAGANNFDLMEVRAGLRAGEQVVVGGKLELAEGQRVRAAPGPPMRRGPVGGE